MEEINKRFFSKKTIFVLKIILVVVIYILVSVFVSVSIVRALNSENIDNVMEAVLDKTEIRYALGDKSIVGQKEPGIYFGGNNEHYGRLFIIDNNYKEINGRQLPFGVNMIADSTGSITEGQYTYFYRYYSDVDKYFIVEATNKFVRSVSPSIISGVVALNVTLSILLIILLWILKNAYYEPIVKIEDQIEEILEEGYIPGRDFTYMIKSHALSSRFEQVIMMLRELIEKEYNETILRKQAELNALQGQINPHFLYNTLDTIRGQALWEGMDSIADMTQALAKCLRYCININNDMVTLAEEFENVENYIKIQKTRFSEKLQFEIDIDEQMDKDIMNYKVPKLTIQPIVENAVYHGLEKKKEKGKVTIKAFATDTRLSINIIDDGMGIPIERLKTINKNLYLGQASVSSKKSNKKQSIGLYIVNQRIKLYYGDEFGLRIQSVEGKKTNVEIIVPIIE